MTTRLLRTRLADRRVHVLHLFRRFPLTLLRHFTEQVPVLMVLGLSENDAFRGDDLRRSRFTLRERYLHRLHQRLTNGAHHLATRCFFFRLQSEFLKHVFYYSDVSLGLLQIFVPLFFQVIVLDAT